MNFSELLLETDEQNFRFGRDDHECTAEQFQWSGVYNRLTGED